MRRRRKDDTMYTAASEEVLVEFSELCKQYPNEAAADLFVKAGGRDDAYRYVSCSWCGKQYPYNDLEEGSHDQAEDEANAHALTCEKDPRAAELARLQAVEQAARSFMNEVPEGEIELAREAWGNTNTRCVYDKRRALAAALNQTKGE
jgi:hypothetical protein